jgi:hypothetical protein
MIFANYTFLKVKDGLSDIYTYWNSFCFAILTIYLEKGSSYGGTKQRDQSTSLPH